MKDFRKEKDFLGEIEIPKKAYWGVHTQRTLNNFKISGIKFPFEFIKAIVLIKRYAAEVNKELGLINKEIADSIIKACEEILEGNLEDQFPIDIFQTGSGTSTNMNVNEVIANRANEILGYPLGNKKPVHPNDHVNLGQSSNDVIPSAIHITARIKLEELLGSLQILYEELKKKEEEFKEIIKAGRTHLQDAVPITLGQEFSSYAEQIKKGIERIKFNSSYLEELPLGGTAIGTGINTHPEFGKKVIDKISQRLGISFKEASNKFEGISAKDAVVHLMGSLNTLCVSLMKIANDLRILSSGPRTAIGEIILPAIQAGSSIMPGKVNPVIPEIMMQICVQVMGNALTVSIGGQNAPLELNVMMPIIAYNMIFSIEILKNGIKIFAEKCIRGIEADVKRCRELMEWSIGIITPLALKIGYDKAAEIAFKAYKENKKIKDVLVEEGILTSEEVEEILKPEKMLGF